MLFWRCSRTRLHPGQCRRNISAGEGFEGESPALDPGYRSSYWLSGLRYRRAGSLSIAASSGAELLGQLGEVVRDYVERWVWSLRLYSRAPLQRTRYVGCTKAVRSGSTQVVGVSGDEHYLLGAQVEQARWHKVSLWVGLVVTDELG